MKEFANEYDQINSNLVNKKTVMKIVDKKMMDTDTIDELVEAMKLFDSDKDGRLNVPELRWAMTKLGDVMDEAMVDEMIKEADGDNDGFIDILEFSKICFNIKEKWVNEWMNEWMCESITNIEDLRIYCCCFSFYKFILIVFWYHYFNNLSIS